MDVNNITNIEVNQLEYCILEETIILPIKTVRVKVPKLTIKTESSRTFPNTSILVNDTECKPKRMNAVELSTGISLKVFSNLSSSNSVKKRIKTKDPLTYEYYIPKGTQMIACFMNNNINDGYLTNFL